MNATDVDQAILSLTESGLHLMKLVGDCYFDFFDGGIVEGEGIWGNSMSWQLSEALGKPERSAAGIMVGTKKAGLWDVSEQEDGKWWTLTALGAAVANALSTRTPEPQVTTKVGRKWTYIYVDGALAAEVRNDAAAAVIAALQN